jgi:5'-methylthioadenosine phosphorylase
MEMDYKTKDTATIGIIGGTGLDSLEGFDAEDKCVYTHYGNIDIKVGTLEGRRLVFVPRHGKDHSVPPHAVNYRGNISALKTERCDWVVAFSSVGSMDPSIHPGTIVIPRGWLLYNVHRPNTFFEQGAAVHIDPEPPFCRELTEKISDIATLEKYHLVSTGSYLCIQGPHFLTELESEIINTTIQQTERKDEDNFYAKRRNPNVIGMSVYPEAILAREAEMCYAMIAMVTDYNKLPGKPHVSVAKVIETANQNTEKAKVIIQKIAAKRAAHTMCRCASALDDAVQSYHPELMTDRFSMMLIENARKRGKK